MAFVTTRLHGLISLSGRIYYISNTHVMQQALTFLTIFVAAVYLVYVFYGQLTRKKNKCGDCGEV
jgi:hypothetical protein